MAQGVRAALLESITRFDPRRASLATLWYRTAKFTVANHFREQKRKPRLVQLPMVRDEDGHEKEIDPPAPSSGDDTYKHRVHVLRYLDKQDLVILLRRGRGETCASIAISSGVTAQAIHARDVKAKARLHELVKQIDRGEDPGKSVLAEDVVEDLIREFAARPGADTFSAN
jgi:DNA-directed RNA polymerase specialized sigma24 family protein